jgi:hypothetical protein
MKTLFAFVLTLASTTAFAANEPTPCDETIFTTVNAAISGDAELLKNMSLQNVKIRNYGSGAMGEYSVIKGTVFLFGNRQAQVIARQDGSGNCEVRSLHLVD